ncbi:DUF2730 family protein [uncultured Cohaesibacter sp.]|uniref:DUF2730 family protein n=1 Tax=uncultured Cohaesibacter sp. TaxID=1002546 RepID=UPI0029C9A2EB|nr:DUF2730 family protein [uncultured Cohaesibacter sp.]
MSAEDLKLWLAIVTGCLGLVVSAIGYLRQPSKDNSDKITKLTSSVDELDRRVQSIEDEIKHLPDKEQSHSLELTMTKLSGRLDAFEEKLKPIGSIADRLQEFLLEQAKR